MNNSEPFDAELYALPLVYFVDDKNFGNAVRMTGDRAAA